MASERVPRRSSLFGIDLDRLNLRVLREFLADAGDEPLSWEAKADGPEPLTPRTLQKTICAFANSDRGGYLLLGVAHVENGDRWDIPGLQRAPRDLSAWVSQAADQIIPRPMIDVRTFRASRDRGRVAAVWIPPVDEPPAMTSRGSVYIRVAGASPAVTDPRVLSELFERGVAARRRTEERSLAAANPGPRGRSARRIASFGAAATQVTSPPIYRSGYADSLEAIAREHLAGVVPVSLIKRSMDHERITARIDGANGWRAELQAHRNGAVGVHIWCQKGAQLSPRHWAAEPAVGYAAWSAIAATMRLAGATGRVHLRVSVLNELPPVGMADTSFDKWTTIDEPIDPMLDEVGRDLLRSMGEWVEEP